VNSLQLQLVYRSLGVKLEPQKEKRQSNQIAVNKFVRREILKINWVWYSSLYCAGIWSWNENVIKLLIEKNVLLTENQCGLRRKNDLKN
jgi:hypothetical protein